eukprot:7531141-Lingulodinium_polyedra.AAC.1
MAMKGCSAYCRPCTRNAPTGSDPVGHLVPPGAVDAEQDPWLVGARSSVVEGSRGNVHRALDK